MTDEVQKGMDEVIMLHINGLKNVAATQEKQNNLVRNLATLYELRQKDDEREEKYHDLQERRVYENGRADEELRAKEHLAKMETERLDLDRERLDFEREKYQTELAVRKETNEIEREKLKSSKVEQFLRTVVAGAGLVFNTWVTSNVLKLEETGVVGSFIAKKVFGSMLGKAPDKM